MKLRRRPEAEEDRFTIWAYIAVVPLAAGISPMRVVHWRNTVRPAMAVADAIAGGRLDNTLSAAKMEEIVASIAQVCSIIQEIDRAIGQMDAVTPQNAVQMEQVAAAAESLEEQARHLQKLVAYFRLESETRPALR